MSTDLEPIRAPTLERSAPWRRVLDVWLDGLDSPHTRRSYERHVVAALEHAGVASTGQLTGEQLAAWRKQVTDSELAPGSQAQMLAALRSFLKWGGTVGAHALPNDLIALLLKTPRSTVKKPYNVLNPDEAGRLLAAGRSERDRALVALLLGAGLRAGELVALDVSDLHEDADGVTFLHVRAGKGRKDRHVPIRAELVAIVRRYLAASGRHVGSEGSLLLSGDAAKRRPDRRLSTRAVGYLIDRLCQRAAIDAKKISPHSLRHTYARRALRARADLPAVQALLGHASPATTARYLDHWELEELLEAVPELPT